MGKQTAIEWADSTWGPVTGCDKVSPGCKNCYAETLAHRFDGTPQFPNGFKVTLRPERLELPLRWKKPKRIFVNSMSDLWHDDIPDDYIAQIWAVMARAQQHTFQILTKRHGRMRALLTSDLFYRRVYDYLVERDYKLINDNRITWPLPNVWLGVSVENQQWADIRIPVLLKTPAAVRFISAEPLLGAVDLHPYWIHGQPVWGEPEQVNNPNGLGVTCKPLEMAPALDWVIVGGESGAGARRMDPEWARHLHNQCAHAGVAFMFKQAGSVLAREWGSKGKGGDPDGWPEPFPRQYPT